MEPQNYDNPETYTDLNSDEALIDEKLAIMDKCEKIAGFKEQLQKAKEILLKYWDKDVILVDKREWKEIDVDIRNNIYGWIQRGLI